MEDYNYQNKLFSKKNLRQILGWSFQKYNCMEACSLADELKYLGFKYASQAGISISIEDLRVPFSKNLILEKANFEILNSEKIYLKGKLTDVERFQKIIDTWNLTSESLKTLVIHYFKNYDPLNSVYMMAFSGARGNLSQVRQLVGMRGLMSDPSGQILNLPIKKNFREGLTITDYLMSGYGARKGIVDTALKTANSGYLTRRLIDVAQDILIREKDCLTLHSFQVYIDKNQVPNIDETMNKLIGRILHKPIIDKISDTIISKANTQITSHLAKILKQKTIPYIYIRSPLTCNLYRAICQKCYGWDLASENLIDLGEAVGILAGQSIGEPGTQLTMRTFHTGGIFTSEITKQIISPINSIIKFSNFLKTIRIRTVRGENVLLTKNSGSILLIPINKDEKLIKIEITRNTILFPKNNQYILKDAVIGELINTNRQVKKEIKPIITYSAGEIIVPRLKYRSNLLKNTKFLWLLFGKLYNSPPSSFINFYSDFKINKLSFIFRTKLLNYFQASAKTLINKKNNQIIKLKYKKYKLKSGNIKYLTLESLNLSLLYFQNDMYLLYTYKKDSKIYLQKTQKNSIGKLLNNSYLTKTGGKIFYDKSALKIYANLQFFYRYSCSNSRKYPDEISSYILHRTLLWLDEETHLVNVEQTHLLINSGDFICKNFELIPDRFSKNKGLVEFQANNNMMQTITIKPCSLYKLKAYKTKSNRVIEGKYFYYPGEKLFSNIIIYRPSLCELKFSNNLNSNSLSIRNIILFEFAKPLKNNFIVNDFESTTNCLYKSNQFIKTIKSLNLVSENLIFTSMQIVDKNIAIQLINNKTQIQIDFLTTNRLSINNFIPPKLKFKTFNCCLLIQQNQFIDKYNTLLFIEDTTNESIEIVKFRINKSTIKQILLISNDDCITVKRKNIKTKALNDFIINPKNINQIGKIIITNLDKITIQKGQPYFFPNCKSETNSSINIKCKIIPFERNKPKFQTNYGIHFNTKDMLNTTVDKTTSNFKNSSIYNYKINFAQFFFKKDSKLYTCLIPQFLKKFSVKKKKEAFSMFDFHHAINKNKIDVAFMMKYGQSKKNYFKSSMGTQLTCIKYLESPFEKCTKSVGLYSITEDYFEQENNLVFYNNNQFIENGGIIGLLNLEKEITGDIVQGLPRIEEILEARKKKTNLKRMPTNQKKGLLTQKSSLDPDFEFYKLALSIKENEKINPHKLLKVFFNYFGCLKSFYLGSYLLVNRLVDNSEGSYKSLKKVQSFILKSIQSVYEGQGVTINDKHLEVIIKQLTTKVSITYAGDTPLLQHEIIDLYHIEYINMIMKKYDKQIAFYIPILLGLTKASLNNPSFISAASFQETIKVLTKAAIDGRIDWLRGLKENVIIGDLIPSGTGSRNYKYSFTNRLAFSLKKLK